MTFINHSKVQQDVHVLEDEAGKLFLYVADKVYEVIERTDLKHVETHDLVSAA